MDRVARRADRALARLRSARLADADLRCGLRRARRPRCFGRSATVSLGAAIPTGCTGGNAVAAGGGAARAAGAATAAARRGAGGAAAARRRLAAQAPRRPARLPAAAPVRRERRGCRRFGHDVAEGFGRLWLGRFRRRHCDKRRRVGRARAAATAARSRRRSPPSRPRSRRSRSVCRAPCDSPCRPTGHRAAAALRRACARVGAFV